MAVQSCFSRRSQALGIVFCLAGPVWADNTTQDFSAIFPPPPVGGYVLQQLGLDPGPSIEMGGWDGNFLRLANENITDQRGVIAFNRIHSGAFDDLFIEFDFRISSGTSGGADGIGFVYADTANFGTTGGMPDWTFMEEPNLAGSVGVGFDTWRNDGRDPAGFDTTPNSISLHWDGAVVAQVSLEGGDIPFLDNDVVHHAIIDLRPVTGGLSATVVVDNGTDFILPFINTFIPGAAAYEGRPVFAARTGGATSNHDLDNIAISFEAAGTSTVDVFNEGFQSTSPPDLQPMLLGGTPYTEVVLGSSPDPQLVHEGRGDNDGVLRLTVGENDLRNVIAFDQTSPLADPQIVAEFDLRITKVNGGSADGMSFMLAKTDEHGSRGPLSLPALFIAEEPEAAGLFGLAFDTWNNGEEFGDFGDEANHVSLHWDGSEVGFVIIDPMELALDGGVFHHVQVVIDQVTRGSEVTVIITDGSDGSVHTPFDSLFIAGMTLDKVRAAFGGRTGGLNSLQDIDNVNVQFNVIPEPAPFVTLALAGLMTTLRRRWIRG